MNVELNFDETQRKRWKLNWRRNFFFINCLLCRHLLSFSIFHPPPLNTSLSNSQFLSFSFQMSHLYSMFAKQVQTYCKSKRDGDASQCKKNMMLYGVAKLSEMEESHLDQMDPYQRNANIIRKCRLLSNSIAINPCQTQTTHTHSWWLPLDERALNEKISYVKSVLSRGNLKRDARLVIDLFAFITRCLCAASQRIASHHLNKLIIKHGMFPSSLPDLKAFTSTLHLMFYSKELERSPVDFAREIRYEFFVDLFWVGI